MLIEVSCLESWLWYRLRPISMTAKLSTSSAIPWRHMGHNDSDKWLGNRASKNQALKERKYLETARDLHNKHYFSNVYRFKSLQRMSLFIMFHICGQNRDELTPLLHTFCRNRRRWQILHPCCTTQGACKRFSVLKTEGQKVGVNWEANIKYQEYVAILFFSENGESFSNF